MGMSRHDAYYEPEDDSDAIAFEEAEHEAWKMIQKGQQYDFQTTQAISEMFGELDVEQDKALQAIIDEGDFEKIGRKIICMAEDYMMGHALDTLGVSRD
jgi:D-mannonate dehydratase